MLMSVQCPFRVVLLFINKIYQEGRINRENQVSIFLEKQSKLLTSSSLEISSPSEKARTSNNNRGPDTILLSYLTLTGRLELTYG
jgi:hypothetical protein